ncbi:MAG: hypothetical protein R3A51_13440 [Nannocystaceae bacterium]|nr:hypothetical protein [Myxococcales bacterium]
MQRKHLTTLTSGLLAGALTVALAAGCGGEDRSNKILDELGPAAKKPEDIKTEAKPKMTEEELKEARRKAGFIDQDEVAAENAKIFEKGAREYIKTRMKEYQLLIADIRKSVDDIEKQSAAWAKAKDPQKAFDKWNGKFRDQAKALIKSYDKVTGHGAEGGFTQAELGPAFRAWEDLKDELGPDIASNDRFAETLKQIREGLDKVEKALTEIDKDESLVINKFYDAEKDGEEEGGGEEGGGGEDEEGE